MEKSERVKRLEGVIENSGLFNMIEQNSTNEMAHDATWDYYKRELAQAIDDAYSVDEKGVFDYLRDNLDEEDDDGIGEPTWSVCVMAKAISSNNNILKVGE